ncbi:LANO_0B03202g1_1 [Lachancea nothofagi CBS 11611]|uniref:F-actin-capping protein subunit beta n=1 Tax=Lachancea nothofagi CBS 11611 TaxID=1266666 RepID=A0A1G4IWK7_9SACH|nr:LANO_0B03202g1_1 [Lachancea nothofagi CBS 11611]
MSSFDAALDLLRRLDPIKIEEHLGQLIQLDPSLAEDLLASVDTPLQVKKDPNAAQKEFLACDYNRDIDSHRSPWSNKYVPALSAADLEESPFPTDSVRRMEELANDSFDIYRDLYYEGGVSSVYMWDLGDDTEDFAGAVLLKKGGQSHSSWDAIHVFEAGQNDDTRQWDYRVTTTIILHLDSGSEMRLSGNLTRQTEKSVAKPVSVAEGSDAYKVWHISNLGSLVEDVESQMRNQLEVVYFDKSRDIYRELRDQTQVSSSNTRSAHEDVVKGLQGM